MTDRIGVSGRRYGKTFSEECKVIRGCLEKPNVSGFVRDISRVERIIEGAVPFVRSGNKITFQNGSIISQIDKGEKRWRSVLDTLQATTRP